MSDDDLVPLLRRSIEMAQWRQRLHEFLSRGATKARPIRVTPKGSREHCRLCGEAMIAGQPFIGRRLLCGPCARHSQGAPMEPRTAETDDGPRAA